MRLIKSKKAIGVDDLFPLLFVLIAFVVIILVFTYSQKKDESNIESELIRLEKEVKATSLLQEYLSTKVFLDLNAPIDYGLPGDFAWMTMAELIALAYHNPIYKDVLVSESQIILQSFEKPSKETTWNIAFYTMPNNNFFETVRDIRSNNNQYPALISYVSIPLPGISGEYIQVRIFEILTISRTNPIMLKI